MMKPVCAWTESVVGEPVRSGLINHVTSRSLGQSWGNSRKTLRFLWPGVSPKKLKTLCVSPNSLAYLCCVCVCACQAVQFTFRWSLWSARARPTMYPATLQHLAVRRVCADFDDGNTLYNALGRVLPPRFFQLIEEEHRRSCMRVILGYYYHNGEKYCRQCIRSFRPARDQYQVVQVIGPIQISNWYRIESHHRCVACRSVPYMVTARAASLVFNCQCTIA